MKIFDYIANINFGFYPEAHYYNPYPIESRPTQQPINDDNTIPLQRLDSLSIKDSYANKFFATYIKNKSSNQND